MQGEVIFLEDDELSEPLDVYILFVFFATLRAFASSACLVGDRRGKLNLV